MPGISVTPRVSSGRCEAVPLGKRTVWPPRPLALTLPCEGLILEVAPVAVKVVGSIRAPSAGRDPVRGIVVEQSTPTQQRSDSDRFLNNLVGRSVL